MDIYEITAWSSGVNKSGVNYLQPSDSFQDVIDGYIYRQVLQSRRGFGYFAPRLAGATRIMGIFDFIKPDGTYELLATDLNFLYRYNTTTGVFDQLAFGGSMAGYAGFAIGGVPKDDNDGYISGVSYPTASNGTRFVFTGKGIAANAAGSAVFFYDGTNVKNFTSVMDNLNYAAPVEGALSRATYVFYLNGRINFVIPTVNAVQRNQGVLYSGIRTTSGNGDKFNVAGAGLFQFSTYEDIRSCGILGDDLIVWFSNSVRALEITSDAFNPYRPYNIPSAIGVDAPFSCVSWAQNNMALGKEGALQTDSRAALRFDNKIPSFTADEVDELNFGLTYGGFDRITGQFLWFYKSADSDASDITQDKTLVYNYEEKTWSIYNQRFSVLGQTVVGTNLTWNDIDETAGNLSWSRWDTTEETWNNIGIGNNIKKTLAGDDLGFIYELNQDFDDYFASVSAITKASNAVATISASSFKAGDVVIFENIEGMTQINEIEALIVSATPTSITTNIDSTLFDTFTAGGTVTKPVRFSAKTIPLNPYRNQGRKIRIAYVEFLLDCNGGSLNVDVYDDENETPFLADRPIATTLTTQEREWVTMTVNHEANFITFALKQSSYKNQIRLTNMRIHALPGGLTS